MPLNDGFYEICGHIDCMHFIEENDVQGEGIAPYLHLDDGEKEHDHDAIPSGIIHTLTEWSKIWPELFRKYPDGKIGPNSSQFEV